MRLPELTDREKLLGVVSTAIGALAGGLAGYVATIWNVAPQHRDTYLRMDYWGGGLLLWAVIGAVAGFLLWALLSLLRAPNE
jgi:hypothetical protein